ncbi:MAG: hypothetical protein ACXABY_02775 [Candidatus Thorarchaeota archaeon]|jgi:hypothetical protein
MEITPPIQGIMKGLNPGQPLPAFSEYMNNVRPVDVLEKRIRIGQRPGLDKWGAGTLIGAAEQPVVALCTVTTVV